MSSKGLTAALRAIEGLEVTPDAPLGSTTTLRVGGAAELLVHVFDRAALKLLLAAVAEFGADLLFLGQGANVVVPDEGLEGVVARLKGDFVSYSFEGDGVRAGAAVPLGQLARRAAQRGLVGLEALGGFPATVGGSVWMNAGCYGTETSAVLRSVELMARDGSTILIGPEDLQPGYRSTSLQSGDLIVIEAVFALEPGDSKAALARLDELNRRRWQSLPSGRPNAGSVFKNPEGDAAGRLIEDCGLKGLVHGGAQISEQHANVIVNLGDATAGDVVALMRAAREAVEKRFGVVLEPELRLLGRLSGSV